MGPPPVAEFFDHGGSDGYVAVLAAFAIANVQTRRVVPAVNVPHADGDCFADAETAMIHETQARAEANFRDGAKQRLHFGP